MKLAVFQGRYFGLRNSQKSSGLMLSEISVPDNCIDLTHDSRLEFQFRRIMKSKIGKDIAASGFKFGRFFYLTHVSLSISPA